MQYLYALVIYLLTPVILLHLLWRGLRNRAYLRRWPERFGIIHPPAGGGIVIHAVSVGEVNAASPLVRELRNRYPNAPLTVTTFTPTGSERVTSLFGDQVFHSYAPLDLPGAVQRFYDRLNPRLVIIMETEIWPNLYRIAERRDIPVIIANARISEKSLRGYRTLQPLTGRVLESVDGVAAQTETDAARLRTCGVPPDRIHVVGSLKFDVSVAPSLLEQAEFIRVRWGASRSVVIAASTHEGDDEVILPAFAEVLERLPDALLVLVPRHPERFSRAAQLARQQGFSVEQRSNTDVCDPATQCFVIDTMGELLRYCAAANVAVVGGSFEAVGGHNVLEPAALGKPVVIGPHMFNFEEITQHMVQRKAAVQVSDWNELSRTLIRLLQDPAASDTMGQAGLKLIEEGRGALQHTLAMIRLLLDD